MVLGLEEEERGIGRGSFGFSYFVVIVSCRNNSDRIVAVVEALSIFFL